MKKNLPRPVEVVPHGDSWAVKFLDRKKYGKGMAACFYGRIKTRDQVIEWVMENPKLYIPDPNPTARRER